jgi:hypothetical protein
MMDIETAVYWIGHYNIMLYNTNDHADKKRVITLREAIINKCLSAEERRHTNLRQVRKDKYV